MDLLRACRSCANDAAPFPSGVVECLQPPAAKLAEAAFAMRLLGLQTDAAQVSVCTYIGICDAVCVIKY